MTRDGKVDRELTATAMKPRPRKPSTLTRTVAVGAVTSGMAFGMLSDVTAPTANAAFADGLFSAGSVTGNGNTIQFDVLSGNVINPQLTFFGGRNVSDISTVANVSNGNGNGNDTQVTAVAPPGTTLVGQGLFALIRNGDTIQIDILSGNVINPQLTFFGGRNISNISTIANVSNGNGNSNSTHVTAVAPTGTALVGQGLFAITRNGDTIQIDILSGNVINPQLSLFGGRNISNISTTGNLSSGNGSGNITHLRLRIPAGTNKSGEGSLLIRTANGNSTQITTSSANVTNPQLSLFGGRNISNISTTGNLASGNGNGNSTNVRLTAPPGTNQPGYHALVIRTANGNSTQTTTSSANVTNPQLSLFGGHNISNISTTGNLASGNGNGNSTKVRLSAPPGTNQPGYHALVIRTANGNSTQTTTSSANVTNPQLSVDGQARQLAGNDSGMPDSANTNPTRARDSYPSSSGRNTHSHAVPHHQGPRRKSGS